MLSEDYLIEQLNAPTRQERLMAVTGLKKLMDDGFLEKPLQGEDINNHTTPPIPFLRTARPRRFGAPILPDYARRESWTMIP